MCFYIELGITVTAILLYKTQDIASNLSCNIGFLSCCKFKWLYGTCLACFSWTCLDIISTLLISSYTRDMDLWMTILASSSTNLAQTKMSQQLPHGLPQNCLQLIMVPRGWILQTLMILSFPVLPPWLTFLMVNMFIVFIDTDSLRLLAQVI